MEFDEWQSKHAPRAADYDREMQLAGWNGYIEWSGQKEQVADLVMLVKRLSQALRNAEPESELPEKAVDYLLRQNLFGVATREIGR